MYTSDGFGSVKLRSHTIRLRNEFYSHYVISLPANSCDESSLILIVESHM